MSSMTLFIIFVSIIALLFLFINLVFAPHNPKIWTGKSINWVKLSNSGKTLKLLILSINRKVNCGWSNYSGIVISQKIYESIIGNRGSKSALLAVKEQRVYGSCTNNLVLRCTLVGFERSYQAKIPSNSINFKRNLSTLESKLNPSYISGELRRRWWRFFYVNYNKR